MQIPTDVIRPLGFVYRGRDTQVRLLGEETIDFTTATGEITRTYTESTVVALVGPEKASKEGRTRCFAYLVSTFPIDPPTTTMRIVYQDLVYEPVSWTVSGDGAVFKVETIRP